MKANPGGIVDPADVIGRNELIARLWEVLGRQSVVLTAERRMGKTSVVRKMKAETPDNRLAVWRDLEGVRTPLEFVEKVFQDVEDHLTRRERVAARAREVLASLSGAELAGKLRFPNIAAAHWKVILTKTLEDLAEHQDRPIIFFWDEMPLMLKNFVDDSGEKVAMEVLDTLRELRQTHQHLRMVFTGSIGLHNVISSLKRRGYANAPVNDMQVVELPPLAPAHAADLAGRLLEGEGLDGDSASRLAAVIAEAVDCVPYYIHHVVDRMKQRGGTWDAQAVRDLVTGCLTDSHDPWELLHYRQRVDVYYEPADRPIVLAMLDALAGAPGPLTFADLFNFVKSQVATNDEEKARDLLTLLRSDHYAIQDPDGRYRFRYALVQRWWRLHRGLTQ